MYAVQSGNAVADALHVDVSAVRRLSAVSAVRLSPPKLSVSIQSSGSRDSGVDCIFQVLASDICSTPIGYVSS